MRPDTAHIKEIKVVSNTHWDREFRRSFEKTRRRLLTMLDITLDILQRDPQYHSFTMDGHCIMLEDYLEMRPERRPLVEQLLKDNRLIAGPWFTLAEEFSIGAEPLLRNFMWGRKTVQNLGGRVPSVAYTPSSWGQTGQLPQILADFGCDKMMFYRGISHHEADAEWVWQAPDGTRMLASRFAVYARYNWFYQVHRPVTSGRTFEKDYLWGEYDEIPFRFADSLAGEDLAFDLKAPAALYNKDRLKEAIEKMIEREGRHFTTPVFLAMNGHDISVAFPRESEVIADAKKLLGDQYIIEHTNLEGFWAAAQKHLQVDKLPVLTGERRAYLKQGMWTYLLPNTISSRTYLKQKDFAATVLLTAYAEPLAALATALGAEYPQRYLDRGWRSLLSNHTHDANGGCAPDTVCLDMEYRYRVASDIGEIVMEDTMSYVAKNLSAKGQAAEVMQLVVFNSLPFERDAVVHVDLEVPAHLKAKFVSLEHPADKTVARQPISAEKSGSFVESPWEVSRILDSTRVHLYARFSKLPALGYRSYTIKADPNEPRGPETLVTGPNTMANEHLAVSVNANGTINITCKKTGKVYANLNYLTDQGEVGNAWKHVSPTFDRKYNSLSARANVAVTIDGPVVAAITADYVMAVPIDYADGKSRNTIMVDLPVQVEYRLEKGSPLVKVTLTVDNRARDHWLRVNFPTGLKTEVTSADSHFDVVNRLIAIPDSTGWAEKAGGTQPLRTFVSMTDGVNGLSLLPKGIYEYEAFDDAAHTLALTLIRACRVKLVVSEEKQTELPDLGIQCPGVRQFEYALAVHPGGWSSAGILHLAADYAAPVRAAMTGRGQGELPMELSLLTLDNPNLPITAVKQAEDGKGLIVRLFNALADEQTGTLRFHKKLASAALCKADETVIEALQPIGNELRIKVGGKKIRTYRVQLV